MADNDERIVLEVDDSQALAAQKRTAKGFDDVEKSAARATGGIARTTDEAGQRVVRVMDRSKTSIDRIVANAEKKAALMGKTGVERLMVERQQVLNRVSGDAQAVERVNKAYDDMARSAKGADRSLLGLAKTAAIAYAGFRGLRLLYKDLILDSALYAARTEQLGVALNAVARANGIATVTAKNLENQVKALGITTQEARLSLSRLTAGGIDVSRAPELARAAQNVGRVAGIPSSDALEKLTHAIITLQPELFKYLGLNVSLEQAYKRWARENDRTVESLTEVEKRQIATNEAIRAASAYAGVYAESYKTAGGQILSLDRYIKEFRNSIGNVFLEDLRLAVSWLNRLGQAATTAGENVGKALEVLAFGMGTAGPQSWRDGTKAVEIFTAATESGAAAAAEAVRQDQLSAASKKLVIDANRRAADVATRRAEEEKKAATERARAEQHVAQLLRQAQLQEVSGIQRIRAEREQLIQVYGKSEKAIRDLNEATKIQIARELRLAREENATALGRQLKEQRDAQDEALGFETKVFQQKQEFERETLAMRIDTLDKEAAAELASVRHQAEIRLSVVEATAGRSVQAQIELSEKRLQIETETVNKEAILHIEAIARRQAREVEYLQTMAQLRPEMASEIEERVNAVILASAQEASEIDRARVMKIEELKRDQATRSANIMQSENERVFNEMKRSVEAAFDAMITGTGNLGTALKRMLLASVLAPIRQIFSTYVAGGLTQIFGGSIAGASGMTGAASRLATFGGLTIPGLFGAPGGRPGFAGPVGGFNLLSLLGIGSSVIPRAASSFASLGIGQGLPTYGGLNLMQLAPGIQNAMGTAAPTGLLAMLGGMGLFNSGSIALGGGAATTAAGIGGLGGTLAGIASSPAGIFSGGLLTYLGAKRGGLLGTGMAIGGGALAGFGIGAQIGSIGGPWGMAIGAAVGGLIGIFSSLFKGAQKKIREKIEAVYGVTIREKTILEQITSIVKQGYGGNIDLGIRSSQVRDIVELYAMQTGQSFGGVGSNPTPVGLYQSGGAIFQTPSYYNQPALNVAGVSGGSGQVVIQSLTLQVNGQAAADVLEGRVAPAIVKNARTVQRASLTAQSQNVGRREAAAKQLIPGLITA